jgi:hypothetical protein
MVKIKEKVPDGVSEEGEKRKRVNSNLPSICCVA